MTSPRSHSQEGSDAHTLSVHLQSQYPLTWPPSVFSPHSSSQLVAEPSPGGQGPGSSSLLAGLGPTGASARQVPAVSSAWLYSLPAFPVRPASAGPGSPGSSRKVVGLLQSALRTLPRLDLPATQEVGPPQPILQVGGRSQSPAPTHLPPTSKLSAPCAS